MRTQKCEACGTTQNIGGILGGVTLCKPHYANIQVEVQELRAQGKQVNIAGIARKMYREQHSTSNYILRDVPSNLWNKAKHKAIDDGVSLREIVLIALEKYLT
jgi:hypothetical protein